MATEAYVNRAIPVVVERSPSGLSGFHLRVGQRTKWLAGNEFTAFGWVCGQLADRRVETSERRRVVRLLRSELLRRTRAVVTAEVAS